MSAQGCGQHLDKPLSRPFSQKSSRVPSRQQHAPSKYSRLAASLSTGYWNVRDACWRRWMLFVGTWGLGAMEKWATVLTSESACSR